MKFKMHLLEKNSRLEEAKEQINYLEDKVMESNQAQQRRRKLFQMRAVCIIGISEEEWKKEAEI